MDELSSNKVNNPGHPSCYTIFDFDFSQLTNDFIFKHSLTFSSGRNFNLNVENIAINCAKLSLYHSYMDNSSVALEYKDGDLYLECHCNTLKKSMCTHQSAALTALKDNSSLKLFFNKAFRQQELKKIAATFGLENEPDLDDYFELKYSYREIKVQPKLKGLVQLGDKGAEALRTQLAFSQDLPAELDAQEKAHITQDFIVFEDVQYSDSFAVSIKNAGLTKDGKIKNPIRQLNASELMSQTEVVDELRFYSAIAYLQLGSYHEQTEKASITSLRSVVKNPLNLDVYVVNPKISQKVTSSSIEAIKLRKPMLDFHLKVTQKEQFYEIIPKLFVDGTSVAYSSLKLAYSFFIRLGSELLFCPDTDLLRVFSFFKKNGNKILIHQSKFEEFRKVVLENLEGKLSIDYAFLKPASKKQLEELGVTAEPIQRVYLSDSESYVLITPMMKYGAVEVPIRSKRRIYSLDGLGEPFEVARDEHKEYQMLRNVQMRHPNFQEQEGFDYFYLHKKHFLDEGWFLDVFEQWREDGIEILGFNDLKNNRLSASKINVSMGVSSGIDWFDTEMKVSFGENNVRLKDIQRSLYNESRFVKLDDGRMGMLPKEWVDKFAAFFRTGEVTADNRIRTSKVNFSVIDLLFKNEVLPEDVAGELATYRTKFEQFHSIEMIDVPKKLKAKLRDYQKHGLNWLRFLDEFNFGGCLADDMGLGKTIQIIAFILSLREKNGQRTHLIVLPTSLLFNWRIELEKFAPSLKYHTIYGVDRKKDHESLKGIDIVFTTYGTMLSDVAFLKTVEFDYIFLDESQAIKNPESKRYKAVRLLKARNRVVLTGTPIENNTFDLYAQFSFANPGLLGNTQRFKDNYAIPIDKFKDTARAKELQQKLHPFLLRRTKKQVATELPDKTEMVIFCEMGNEQRKIYDTYKNEFKLYLQNTGSDELLNQSMHILQGLTKLRQICNSPALLNDDGYFGNESAKIDELMEQIETHSTEHKILVFSQFVGMLELIKAQLDERKIAYEYLTGKTKDRAERVKNFQENEQTRVFLISLKAGGTGLNLTEADYVFIVDPWWNPAVENQAIDRCYRIGQKKNVMAVRLICPNTIEEKILLLQEGKKELIDDLIKVDAKIGKSLAKDDLLALLEE